MSKCSKNFDYSRIKEGKAYTILKPLGILICKLMYKIRYVGRENIPATGGFIIASNHIHAIDPLIIGVGIKKRQLHFMAKRELWNNPIVAWMFTTVNGFPISRGSADTTAFKYAERIPSEGYILGIFPEGTRSKDGKIGKGKRGVAAIAADAKCGVLPVSLYNSDGLKKHTKYTVRFGKLIPYEELGFSEDVTREEQQAVTDRIMDEIKKLQEEGHCE